MDTVYKSQPDRAFWSRAVSRRFSASAVCAPDQCLIREGEKVASAGSCFAANIVPYLEKAGIAYVRTEKPNPVFGGLDIDNFGYSKFSAAFGNVYTPRQLAQLIARAKGGFRPAEDRWKAGDCVIDPFRPGMKFKARDDREFEILRARHFQKTLEAFALADVFVFTLGLTEAWESRLDGAIYPACPGVIAGEFDPSRHAFRNFSARETTDDLIAAIDAIRSCNPRMRFIITVSPVPLVATATSNHVLAASTYSKSALRVAAEEAAARDDGVMYFPAYEIITGPQAPEDFFEADRRNVSQKGVDEVMAAFLAHCELPREAVAPVESAPEDVGAILSGSIIDAECEEAVLGR